MKLSKFYSIDTIRYNVPRVIAVTMTNAYRFISSAEINARESARRQNRLRMYEPNK